MNNFVAMERKVCEICGVTHSHNAGILLDKRLKEIPDDKTITGYGLCEDCDSKSVEWIGLIGVDPEKSNNSEGDTLKFEDAYRTGHVAHLKRSAVNDIFNVEIDPSLPFIFVENEVIDVLKEMVKSD